MFTLPDGASAAFLACFLLGLLFIVASAVLGLAHDFVHLPGAGHAGADAGHVGAGNAGAGHADVGHGSAGHGPIGHGSDTAASHSSVPTASPFNLMTVMTFLTWFGGAGYALDALLGWNLVFSLVGAMAAGLLAGWLVWLFLVKVLLPGTASPDPRDYRVVGSLARVSIPIPLGGSGEVVYTLGGARHGDGARSVDGSPIARDAEVVIVRYEKGIAYVQTFDSLCDASAPALEGDSGTLGLGAQPKTGE